MNNFGSNTVVAIPLCLSVSSMAYSATHRFFQNCIKKMLNGEYANVRI